MRKTEQLLKDFSGIAGNPAAQLKALTAVGKKVVGCMPYYCPEELILAAGMVPFGLWGAEMQISESKRYFPAFICSLLQTTLELGIRGKLEGLSAVMVPMLCDSLKGMGANWEYGVKNIPVIPVAHAQNRKTEAGILFTASQMRKIRGQLDALSGKSMTDADIAAAIALKNRQRASLRAFARLAPSYPDLITPSLRSAVLKSAYFMEPAAHTEKLDALLTALSDEMPSEWDGLSVVTTGILADSPDLLRILEENRIRIVDDQVAQESLSFREDVPVTSDPIRGLAERMAAIEGCCVLFDLGKKRGAMLIDQVKQSGADGVFYILTKFCDPDEYDYVPIRRMLDEAGIPCLLLEVDQQMKNYEQARTAIEAFAEMHRLERR